MAAKKSGDKKPGTGQNSTTSTPIIFLFIDSITTMLIHNDPHIFARFIHNILTKMRLYGTGGLIISLEEKTNREVKAEIAQLCDKVIKI